MEKRKACLARQSSSTEVAAIQFGVPLMKPSAKERDNSNFVVENPFHSKQTMHHKNLPNVVLKLNAALQGK